MKLVQVSPSVVDGKIVGMYFMYQVEAQRGMGHQKAKELVIYGIPLKFVDDYVKTHHIKLSKYLTGETK